MAIPQDGGTGGSSPQGGSNPMVGQGPPLIFDVRYPTSSLNYLGLGSSFEAQIRNDPLFGGSGMAGPNMPVSNITPFSPGDISGPLQDATLRAFQMLFGAGGVQP